MIGASIRYGRLNEKLYQFIQRHVTTLTNSKAAFFCVNLTARKEDQGKDTPEGSVYIQTFLKKSPWQPERIAVFAGALYYPRYRWFDKMMIRLIMTLTGGETDTSKEVEYTNWEKSLNLVNNSAIGRENHHFQALVTLFSSNSEKQRKKTKKTLVSVKQISIMRPH